MFHQIFSIMSLRELLEYGANVSVTVKLDDLRAILKEAAGSAAATQQEPPAEEFLSRKEVLAALKIDTSTLWCWEKTGYLVPVEYGGQRRYRVADVQQILKGGRHDR